MHLGGEVEAGHSVDGCVNIMALNVEEFVSNPAASETELNLLFNFFRFIDVSGDIEEEFSQLDLTGGELDFSGSAHIGQESF